MLKFAKKLSGKAAGEAFDRVLARRAADQLEPGGQPADTMASGNGSAHVEPPASTLEPDPPIAEDSGAATSAPGDSEFAATLTSLDEEEQYAIEERAAILEFDGGLSRPEAERMALAEWQGRAPEPDPPDAPAERQALADPWAVVRLAVAPIAPASERKPGTCPKCGELGDLQSKSDNGVWWCGLPCATHFNNDGKPIATKKPKTTIAALRMAGIYATTQGRVFETFKKTGAKAIVTDELPACAPATGWKRVGDANYHILLLSAADTITQTDQATGTPVAPGQKGNHE